MHVYEASWLQLNQHRSIPKNSNHMHRSGENDNRQKMSKIIFTLFSLSILFLNPSVSLDFEYMSLLSHSANQKSHIQGTDMYAYLLCICKQQNVQTYHERVNLRWVLILCKAETPHLYLTSVKRVRCNRERLKYEANRGVP